MRDKNLALNFRESVRLAGLSVSAALLIAGCTVVQGGNASSSEPEKNKAELVANEAALVANDAMTTAGTATSVASANIPIPLPAPRRANPVQVASIDPSAGVSALAARPGLADLTGIYVDYGSALAAADTNKLNTPSDVRRALAALRFQEPDALAEGWYTTRAMIAAEDPVFAQGVRGEVRARGKAAVLEALAADENYIMQLPGVSSASAAVAVSIRNEHQRMTGLAARFMDTAYKFQKQKWGMSTPLPGAAETKSAALEDESLAGKARAVLAALSPVSRAEAYSPNVMTRILTLGAYQVIEGSMEKGLAEGRTPTGRCLNWARLNLNQCIAAARFPSEEAYCTSKHAITEVSSCWAEAVPPSTLAN